MYIFFYIFLLGDLFLKKKMAEDTQNITAVVGNMSSNEDPANTDLQLQKVILRVIKKIQVQRNRACYQNVLDFAKRDIKSLDMDSRKKAIDCLSFSNKIINVGKGGNESFKVVCEECVNNKENILCNDTLNETNIIFSSQVTQTSQENTLNELESFVNDKFLETLKDMISKEVKNTVNDLSVRDNDAKTASCIINDISNNPSDLKCIVEIQQDEIDYLRKQLAIINSQKDEYIKNYLNCHNNSDQTGLIETLKDHNEHLK